MAWSACKEIIILYVKSKEGLILLSFNLITWTDRSSGSIEVNKQHNQQRILFYKEIQYCFDICHVDNHNFLKNIRICYISNQAIYSEERVGSIRPSITFTTKISVTFFAIHAFA